MERVDALWFPDGNIVLSAHGVLFRVFKGILAARSPVFADMLAFPQPEDAETLDGCPVLHLDDSAADTMYFLKALFDYECVRFLSFPLLSCVSLPAFEEILRAVFPRPDSWFSLGPASASNLYASRYHVGLLVCCRRPLAPLSSPLAQPALRSLLLARFLFLLRFSRSLSSRFGLASGFSPSARRDSGTSWRPDMMPFFPSSHAPMLPDSGDAGEVGAHYMWR